MVLTILAILIVLGVAVLAAMIICGVAKPLPELKSISKPFTKVSFRDVPPTLTFTGSDGTELTYRSYPHNNKEKIAILIHGASGSSTSMHAVAKALHAQGVNVYSMDMRGHGGSGPRGDVGYIGQLEDDLGYFIQIIRGAYPQATISMIGFSSGGGFAMRFAGSKYGHLIDHYIALSPALRYDSPTIRPGAGGWAAPFTYRIMALTWLDRLGIELFHGLPAVSFAINPAMKDKLTGTYSFRLQQNFQPHETYLEDLKHTKQPITILVGEKDEVFFPDQFAPLFHPARKDIDVKILPGLSHTDMITDPEALKIISQS